MHAAEAPRVPSISYQAKSSILRFTKLVRSFFGNIALLLSNHPLLFRYFFGLNRRLRLLQGISLGDIGALPFLECPDQATRYADNADNHGEQDQTSGQDRPFVPTKDFT